MGKLRVVVGGQYGSEAKGACAAALATWSEDPLVIRTGGPNAGHTVWGGGKEYKLRQLPTAAVSNPSARLAIAAGSVVDPDLLAKEIIETGTGRFVLVDEMATVLEPHHIDEEKYAAKQLANWSTLKGIGAARAARVMRTAKIWRDVHHTVPQTTCTDVADLARKQLQAGGDVIVEAAQGYGLGLHTQFYPKVTSADCRAIDALAAVGLSPWFSTHGASTWPASLTTGYELEIWVVLRPYPIRVAGESGPLLGETSWQELGLSEEHTTVTNKVRRVGMWDHALAQMAIRANGGPSPAIRVWFSMADQVIPELAGVTNHQFWGAEGRQEGCAPVFELTEEIRHQIQDWQAIVREAGQPINVLGTGPDSYIELAGGFR